MAANGNVAPVIIKRKKVIAGGGHHGGAWKVAYADFVTAMMAFFMLMWLLNATTEKQRKGIADYFSPTIPINRISGGGDGSFGGESVFSEMTLPKNGTGATTSRPTASDQAQGMTGKQDLTEKIPTDAEMQTLQDALFGSGGESMVSDELKKHVVSKITDEGLVVELFSVPDAPLFQGRDQPTELLGELAAMMVRVSKIVTNQVAIEGHVRSLPIVAQSKPVWQDSSRRADVLRVLMKDRGFDPMRVQRLAGHADREPAVKNTLSVRNDRIEVIFLRN